MMLDLMLKRQKQAEFLNSLVQVNLSLAKFQKNNESKNELLARRPIVLVVCLSLTIFTLIPVLDRNRMEIHDHLWNVLQFFQTISITLTAYYIRCVAVGLQQMCLPIFRRISSIGIDLERTNDGSQCRQHISELLICFEAFDEIMNLKTRLSDVFGVQLLLNSAFDFTILTISAYAFLHFKVKSFFFLFYFIAYNVPLVIKCVLLVLALDALANQVDLFSNIFQGYF